MRRGKGYIKDWKSAIFVKGILNELYLWNKHESYAIHSKNENGGKNLQFGIDG